MIRWIRIVVCVDRYYRCVDILHMCRYRCVDILICVDIIDVQTYYICVDKYIYICVDRYYRCVDILQMYRYYRCIDILHMSR